MEVYNVRKIYGNKGDISVTVPGSKSITNRALLIAALAEGESILDGALFCDDSESFLSCIQRLGIEAEADRKNHRIRIRGNGGKLPVSKADINVGSAGTAARFITAFLAMTEGRFFVDSSEQMKKRPMKPLLDALEEMGASVEYHGKEGYFPFTLTGTIPEKTEALIDIDESSQFLSAFLISACKCKNGININVKGSHGRNYIYITTGMMEDFGIKVQNPSPELFIVNKGCKYKGRHYNIEADVSAACYFYAMAAILGISVTVNNVFFSSVQGDIKFVRLLEKMGCTAEETQKGIKVTGPSDGALRGVRVDMSSFSDQALTLAAIAPFADSPVEITGISHIRGQECDRINAITSNLGAMGIKTEETDDGVVIYPGKPKPARIETFEDHRVAMAFAVSGLRTGETEITNPACTRKTFTDFFETLEKASRDLCSGGRP